MKVNRERPSQRLNHRVTAPLYVWVDGEKYATKDWSLGGLSLKNFDAKDCFNEDLEVQVELPFQGFDIRFVAVVSLLRTIDDVTAAKFIVLPDREKELLRHFLEGLVRGEMTDIGETILRIDTPVTPVPTTPDQPSVGEFPKSRWGTKMILVTTLYVLSGVFVLSYVGLMLFGNFFRLEIETAVVDAPLEKLVATSDGRIIGLGISENTQIRQGTQIVAIADPNLEQDIDIARVDIDRATIQLAAQQKNYKLELAKVADYQKAARNEISRIRNRIDSLRNQVLIALGQKRRFETLKDKGWATTSKVDEVKSSYLLLTEKLEEARLLLRERRSLMDSVDEGRYFNGNRVEGRAGEIEVAINQAADHIILSQDELSAMYKHRKRLSIFAPSDGQVLRYLKSASNTAKKGEDLVIFERAEARTIKAFLTQEEIMLIGLGDEASAYVPSLDKRTDVFISHIDRTTGYVDEMNSRYEWRGPKDRSAVVTLQFIGLTDTEIRAQYSPGLPVIITFKRRSKSELKHRVIGSLSEPST